MTMPALLSIPHDLVLRRTKSDSFPIQDQKHSGSGPSTGTQNSSFHTGIQNLSSYTGTQKSHSPNDTQNSSSLINQAKKPAVLKKRIIICCDGTWQDGITVKKRWQYSNVLRLSRMMNDQDNSVDPPIPQIVFYQGGVGTAQNFYSEYIEGATGASLAEKVQEAYAFLAHNYQPGDDVYLFGFSRGAYTARMVAAFIGVIGILDKKDMDSFAKIFVAYQRRANPRNEQEKKENEEILASFEREDAPGILRADPDGDTYTITVLGVFDTVGSLGLPEELTFSPKLKQLFGFSDKHLGEHVNRAYHAMALNEDRADFNVSKFEQTEKGRKKGDQILEQVWFPGSHSDVGGGWEEHDLADISLVWMVSKIEKYLSLDYKYLYEIPRPHAPWGELEPHNPRTGIFKLGLQVQRELPEKTDDITHEMIHPSVMYQADKVPQLQECIQKNPKLVGMLAPLEELFKEKWRYIPGVHVHERGKSQSELEVVETNSLLDMIKNLFGFETEMEAMVDEGGRPTYEDTWLGAIVKELR